MKLNVIVDIMVKIVIKFADARTIPLVMRILENVFVQRVGLVMTVLNHVRMVSMELVARKNVPILITVNDCLIKQKYYFT